MKRPISRAFTIIELLVVVSIIALLIGILLPAIGKARDQAKVSISQSNLRNLGTAHQSYAAEWSDRQLTFVDDNIASYSSSIGAAFDGYQEANMYPGADAEAVDHPPVYLGWCHDYRPGGDEDGDYFLAAYRPHQGGGTSLNVANCSLTTPIVFTQPANLAGFGGFRLPNAKQFNQYVGGKFYDKTFYAPKDKAVLEHAAICFESPDEYCNAIPAVEGLGQVPAWSSYCLSPAAMFGPEVMRHDDPDDPTANGWVDPWTLAAGFRSPSFSQALYPSLKTHMLEHHWLQNVQADCNASFEPGSYGGCEPYYFNHGWESSPMTLFYDGHVEGVGVRKAMRADGRMRAQTGHDNWGLWSRDTDLDGEDGYFIQEGYDQAATSFHILTTDGIRGRDVLGN